MSFGLAHEGRTTKIGDSKISHSAKHPISPSRLHSSTSNSASATAAVGLAADSLTYVQRAIGNNNNNDNHDHSSPNSSKRTMVRSTNASDNTFSSAREITNSLQPKLKVSQPGDIYEQEADRVADQITMMTPSTILTSRPSSDNEISSRCNSSNKMKDEEKEFKKLRISRKPSSVASKLEASDHVTNEINNIHSSSGFPLDTSTKGFMESRFGGGYDFSNVRIHADAKAAKSAQTVNALAYTVGNHIAFGQGQYSPNTTEGRRLLAHELTHVIQQNSVGVLPRIQDTARLREMSDLHDSEQLSIDQIKIGSASGTPFIQRQPNRTSQKSQLSTPPPAAVSITGHKSWRLRFYKLVFRHEVAQWLFKAGEAPSGFVIKEYPPKGEYYSLEWEVSWAGWTGKGTSEFLGLFTPYGHDLAIRAMEGGNLTREQEEIAQEMRASEMRQRHEENKTLIPPLGMTAAQVFDSVPPGAYEENGLFIWLGYLEGENELTLEIRSVSQSNEVYNRDMRWYLSHGYSLSKAEAAFLRQWADIGLQMAILTMGFLKIKLPRFVPPASRPMASVPPSRIARRLRAVKPPATGPTPPATGPTINGRIRPVNGRINVGGGLEQGSSNATNLNPIVPRTGGPGSNAQIPNHVRAGFENIGEIFEDGSANLIFSNRLPYGTVNWNASAGGAYRVMAPGGRLSLNIMGASAEEAAVVVRTFSRAGFRDVRAIGSGSSTIIQGVK
jgi:Domain of unknown function (DUF4157)